MDAHHEYVDSHRPELLRFLPQGISSILDVGCHRGAFGGFLKQSDPDLVVWGIEPNSLAAEVARTRLDKVVHGRWPGDIRAGERFDCLTFNDVLEHLVDPWAALDSAHAYLREGGWVMASVPNVRRITLLEDLALRGRWTYTDEGLLDRTHLRFFTKSSIGDTFRAAGFVIERIGGVGLLGGRRGAVLKGLGSLGEELRALQWVVLARSCRAGSSHLEQR